MMQTPPFSVAILAGGLATRLRPLTEATPKALLEVAGEPFVVHQLRLLARQGIKRVVLCVGFLGERIQQRVGQSADPGLEIHYAHDGQRLLGTAGALKQALPILGDRFFVLYGDSYLPCDFAAVQDAFQQAGKLALMTVFRNAGRWERSNILFRNGRIEKYDKGRPTPGMEHVDYGLGVFDSRAFASLPEGVPCCLADLYQTLLAGGQLAAHEVSERFYEIGSFAGMEETDRYLREANLQPDIGRVGSKPAPSGGSFTDSFFFEAATILEQIDRLAIEHMIEIIRQTRAADGRLFILGVGGSAANASHAVNDFRKLVELEAYAPTDNVSELTARTNDDGWDTVFARWLQASRLRPRDLVLVFSVGGGSLSRNVSPNLVHALRYARQVGARIVGIVGRDGGYTAEVADACVIVPTVNPQHVTPHAEAFQAIIWHLIVSHPALKACQTKWEAAA
jgi:D-sedoheptulose 7-phosphate isomerase